MKLYEKYHKAPANWPKSKDSIPDGASAYFTCKTDKKGNKIYKVMYKWSVDKKGNITSLGR